MRSEQDNQIVIKRSEEARREKEEKIKNKEKTVVQTNISSLVSYGTTKQSGEHGVMVGCEMPIRGDS